MNTDISKLGIKELHHVCLQERIRFAEGLDRRLPWDQLKEICSQLSKINQELKKREKA